MGISEEDKAALWRAGRLKYLLHSDQRTVYDQLKEWKRSCETARENDLRVPGIHPRIFAFDCSRRWGKDVASLVILFEIALQRPDSVLLYATAYYKDIRRIVVKLLKKLIKDCPEDIKPEYKDSYRGLGEGIYFPSGSTIQLVGIDKDPDRLRGDGSDGMCISEAGFCSDLENTVSTVLEPQFMGRNHAFLLMNSTPAEVGNHPWDEIFVPDARDRGAYVMRTIWDAPQYRVNEKLEFLKVKPENEQAVLAGDYSTIANRERREYLCERIRDESKTVLPEFSSKIHVKEFELPRYAHAYTAIDPAVKDLCALNFAVWDFLNARLLILDEFTKRNANTNEIADVIKTKEREHFSSVHFWDGQRGGLKANPFMRVSDVDQRLITDLKQLHGISCIPASKDDAEAALHALRNAFQAGQIWIHPRCVNTIAHCEGATWNKGRTSYERSERLGHADHVDALKYLWRHVARSQNPIPPGGWLAKQEGNRDMLHVTDQHMRHGSRIAEKLSQIFPSRWSRKSPPSTQNPTRRY